MKAWEITIDNDDVLSYSVDYLITGDIVFANTKKEARKKFFNGDNSYNLWDNLRNDEYGQFVLKKEVQIKRAPYLDGYEDTNPYSDNFKDVLRNNGWIFCDNFFWINR